MGFFDFLSSKPTDKKRTKQLVNYVFDSVQEGQGIRVEDAICLISTIVAERCIEVANEYSINDHEFVPGVAIFSDKINEILAGPEIVENWDDLPKESVFGIVRNKIKSKFNSNYFPSIKGVFENYIDGIGKSEWGNIHLAIPIANKPNLLPLKAGYESRKYIKKHMDMESNEHSLSIALNALAHILIKTKMVIDPAIALRLTFEIINGMSKTATMTDKKMDEVRSTMNG